MKSSKLTRLVRAQMVLRATQQGAVKRTRYLYNSRQHAKSGSNHETGDTSKLRDILQNDWPIIFEKCQIHES